MSVRQPYPVSGSTGPIAFTQLTDVPSSYSGQSGKVASVKSTEDGLEFVSVGGTGTVTTLSVVTANGVSGSVANPTTTPAITLTLGAITPTTVNKVTLTTPASGSTLTIADGKTLTVSDNITLAGPTGSGNVVFATSPTLVTPVLGVAAATSINKVAFTAPATSSTLTIDDGFTLHATGNVTALSGSHTGSSSGTNTGDQTNITGNAGTVTTNANLTGPITSSGNATSIASQTGTGSKFVVDTSPTLVTPILGVAAATSINKVAITAPATSATLTIVDGKTLTASNTADVSGTNTGDQLTFKTISVSGQSDVVADSITDTLTLVAGTNVTITTNAGADSITIAASGGGGGGLTGTDKRIVFFDGTDNAVGNADLTFDKTTTKLSLGANDAGPNPPLITSGVAGLSLGITTHDGVASGYSSGSIYISPGLAEHTSSGGGVYINGANGGADSGVGGTLSLNAGSGDFAASGNGAELFLGSGYGGGVSGTPGDIRIFPGDDAAGANYGLMKLKVGCTDFGSITYATIGGTIYNNYSDHTNSTTSETDLFTRTINGYSLTGSGDQVIGEYAGVFINSTSLKRLRVYFAGTGIFDSGALSVSAATSWYVRAWIASDSTSSVRCMVTANLTGASSGAFANYATVTGLTLTGDYILKITGTASGVGAASSDITGTMHTIEWKPIAG